MNRPPAFRARDRMEVLVPEQKRTGERACWEKNGARMHLCTKRWPDNERKLIQALVTFGSTMAMFKHV